MPPKQKRHRNVEARVERTAIMEAAGMGVKEVNKALGRTNQTGYNYRKKAHDEGKVKELQDRMKNSAVNLAEERKLIAEKMFGIVKKSADQIIAKIEADKKADPENTKLYIEESTFALKAIQETEHSGRKVDSPKLVVNMKENATISIQQNLADITAILDRSGVNLDKLVETG